jgi:hypothetical protein
MAPLMEVPPPKMRRGAASMARDTACAEASSRITIQGMTSKCSCGPVHWNMVTAMD